jgi:hypothetical protein
MVTTAADVAAGSVAANLRTVICRAMTLPYSTNIRFPAYMPPTNV